MNWSLYSDTHIVKLGLTCGFSTFQVQKYSYIQPLYWPLDKRLRFFASLPLKTEKTQNSESVKAYDWNIGCNIRYNIELQGQYQVQYCNIWCNAFSSWGIFMPQDRCCTHEVTPIIGIIIVLWLCLAICQSQFQSMCLSITWKCFQIWILYHLMAIPVVELIHHCKYV